MNAENNDRDENQGIDKPLEGVKGYPDVFDDLDCRPENTYPEANRDAVIPDDIKREIEERQKAKGANQAGADDAGAAGQE